MRRIVKRAGMDERREGSGFSVGPRIALIQAAVFMIGVSVVLLNIIIDLIYALADPRINTVTQPVIHMRKGRNPLQRCAVKIGTPDGLDYKIQTDNCVGVEFLRFAD